jgi:hypothetical protein
VLRCRRATIHKQYGKLKVIGFVDDDWKWMFPYGFCIVTEQTLSNNHLLIVYYRIKAVLIIHVLFIYSEVQTKQTPLCSTDTFSSFRVPWSLSIEKQMICLFYRECTRDAFVSPDYVNIQEEHVFANDCKSELTLSPHK